MEAFEAYRSPSVKAEPRWGGRDDMIDRPPPNENYRSRRSPGKTFMIWQVNCVMLYSSLSRYSLEHTYC